jgi:hypothetical protein
MILEFQLLETIRKEGTMYLVGFTWSEPTAMQIFIISKDTQIPLPKHTHTHTQKE